jgi:error-prone DNA polymerase
VEVRPVDVRESAWDGTLERGAFGEPAVRLELRRVQGLTRAGAERLVAARQDAPFADVQDLARRAGLSRRDLECLAAAGALQGLVGHRRRARWAVLGVQTPLPVLPQALLLEAVPLLPRPTVGEDLVADYASLGLTLGPHPLTLLRPQLDRRDLLTAARLRDLSHGSRAHTAGLVITRQRPSSASGVVFITLEDETGHTNVIVWRDLAERERSILLGSRLLGVVGKVQREGEVLHVIARRLTDHSALLGSLTVWARDFH